MNKITDGIQALAVSQSKGTMDLTIAPALVDQSSSLAKQEKKDE